MHGPMRRLTAPTGLPLSVLLVVVLTPFGIANSLRKLGDASSLNDDMDRYALLMLDPAGGADALPSIALPRRITAKSVFIAPSVRPKQPPPCQDGFKRDGSGACVRLVNVDTKNTWDFFVQKLNQQFGDPDPLPPQTAAEEQAAAEAAEAVVVATQVAAEASPPALEPLHFHIPIESVPEVTTTEPPNTESTTLVPTTTPAEVTSPGTTTTSPAETSFEPEVILFDGDKSPSLSLSLAPVVVPEPEVPASTPPSTSPPPSTSTLSPTSPAPYSFKTDVDADPIINSVSDSPFLAGLKRLSPIVVAELPEWPSPSPSAASVAAAEPLDASAVPPRRRPSSSFVRFPGTAPPAATSTSAEAPSSKPVVFPADDAEDPPRRVFFPSSSLNTSAGRRFSTARTHSH